MCPVHCIPLGHLWTRELFVTRGTNTGSGVTSTGWVSDLVPFLAVCGRSHILTATKASIDLPEKHSFFTWFQYAVRQSCQRRWGGLCPLSHVAVREHEGDWCC